MTWPTHYPVFGICGYSGAGKTTLVESLIPRLRAQRLAVAVIKHDVPGPDEMLLRAIEQLLSDHDLIIVVGHKETLLPARIWLEADDCGGPPTERGPWLARLGRDADRLDATLELLNGWLANQLDKQPLRGGLLLGGQSSRMGTPKQMLQYHGRAWSEWVAEAMLAHVDEICLLGAGPVPESLQKWPQLPDVPGRGGPLAGMLAAMCWDPTAAWVFVACDMPKMSAAGIGWLLGHRKPGCWAVLPQQPEGEHIEPLGAWYDSRMATILAECRGPQGVRDHVKTATPSIPTIHTQAWQSFNTRDEADQLG